MRLIADIGRKTLLTAIDGTPTGAADTLFRGDVHALELALLENGVPLDPTGKVVKLGIGLGVDTVPAEGRIKFGFEAEATSQLVFSGGVYPTAEAVSVAINALTTVTAAGGVTVTSPAKGAYRIDFLTDGARVDFSASGFFLPGGQTLVSTLREGTAESNAIQQINIVSGPFALASGFAVDTPVHSFTETTAGVWLLELPATTLQAQIFWDSGYIAGIGASSDVMSNALAYAEIEATATALDARRWLIYGDTVAAPTVIMTAAPVLTADLRLDRSALSAALGAAVTIPAIMEMEITSGSYKSTPLQAAVTISRTVLDDPTLPAGVDSNVYMIKADYDSDDDGVIDLAAAVRKTGGSLTGDQIETALGLRATIDDLNDLAAYVAAQDSLAAKKASNLSDLADKPAAVTNLTTVVDNPATTYTLLSTDSGKIIRMTAATAIALTVPAGLPSGFSCLIIQQGAGQITYTGAGIQSAGGLMKSATQYAAASVTRVAADTYNLSGNLIA